MKEKIQKYLAGEREGFSLVELIIVIAIMAILIGVIALAVIPNIQRSRESKDLQALDNVASAVNIAIANNQVTTGGTITIDKSGTVSCTLATTGTDGDEAETGTTTKKATVKDAIVSSVVADLGGTGTSVSIKLSSSGASTYDSIVAEWTIESDGAARVTVSAMEGKKVLECKYTTDDTGAKMKYQTGNL